MPNGPQMEDGNRSRSGLYVYMDLVDCVVHTSWSTEKTMVTENQAAKVVIPG